MSTNISAKASWGVAVAWLVFFLLTRVTNVVEVLCGKGIRMIDSQYYRFFTGWMVHTNFVHVLGNMYLMLWLGGKYEEYIGSWRFLAIGVLGAVLASVVFLCGVAPNAKASIGGSGVWYALVGFLLISQALNPEFPRISQKWMMYYLLLFNFPFFSDNQWGTLIFHMIAFSIGAGIGACVDFPPPLF